MYSVLLYDFSKIGTKTASTGSVFFYPNFNYFFLITGWARRVGHQVAASQDYYDRCAMDNMNASDCTPDMFPEYRQAHMGNLVPGMKLEAVDPLNLATICVATVMKVLRYGQMYFLH